jgi:PAS domain S-box-containing protein
VVLEGFSERGQTHMNAALAFIDLVVLLASLAAAIALARGWRRARLRGVRASLAALLILAVVALVGNILERSGLRVAAAIVSLAEVFIPLLTGIFLYAAFQEIREQDLRESESRFRQLYERAPLAYQSLDGEGCLIAVNQAWLDMLGYSREEVIGRWLGDFLTPEHLDRFKERFSHLRAGEGVQDTDLEMVRTDGAIIVVRVVTRVGRDERGDFEQTHCILSNVTAQRQAEEALRKSEQEKVAVLDSMAELVVYQDTEMRLVWANRAAAESVNQTQEQLAGRHCYEIWHQRSRPCENCPVVQAFQSGEAHSGGVTSPDGRVWAISGYPVCNESGDIVGAVEVTLDITERKRMEQAEREQRALAEALRDTAAALSSTLEFDEVLALILSSVGRVVPHDTANVMLIESGVARVVGCQGYPDSEHEDQIMALRFVVADTPTFRRMVDTREPLIIPDVSDFPDWVDLPEARWIRSYAGAPISFEGMVYGFVNLNSRQPGTFTPAHAERLRTFADQAAIAIQNARLYEQRQRHAAQLEALHRVTLDITAQLDLSVLLDSLVRSAIKLLDTEAGCIYLYDAERDVLEVEVAVDPDVPRQGTQLKRGEGLSGKVLERGEPMFVNNYSEWEGRARVYDNIPWKAVLGAPIMWGTDCLGIINVYGTAPQRTFSKADARVLSLLAAQAAIAIYNAHMYRGLEAYSELLEQAVARRTSDLSAARERAEAILASVGDQVVVTTLEGDILTVNSSFKRHTGFEDENVAGRDFRMLLGERVSPEALEEMITRGRRKEGWSGELVLRRKDGSEYDVHATVAPIVTQDVELVGFVASLRDITEQKEVERLKDEFIANVSHELRTPLASLKLYHHLLTARPEKRDSYIETLNRETDRLVRIVETLLYLSRMDREQPPVALQLIDLNVLVGQYVTDRMPLAEERGLSLRFDGAPGLPMVEADAELLGHAASMLLTNALSYTPAGGEVTVSTAARVRDGQQGVALTVRDTGPGVPPDEKPRLFERFFRGKAGRDSGVPGSGLGLTIARQIVERHGGQIDVTSEGIPGQGASFEIWLPVEEKPKAEIQNPKVKTQNPKSETRRPEAKGRKPRKGSSQRG